MSTSDAEGPAWNKFWLSLDHETESVMSDSHVPSASAVSRPFMSPEIAARNPLERVDSSVLPNESASHNGDNSPAQSAVLGAPSEGTPFPFKFKAPSGRVHRLQVAPSAGLAELVANVTAKLGAELEAVGGEATVTDGKLGKTGYALSYLDNEGDTVSITTDRDLLEAITLARQGNRDKVDLFIHDPAKPPLSATVDPKPALSYSAATMRKRQTRPASSDREDGNSGEEAATESPGRPRMSQRLPPPSARKQEFIPGVPNELLLPGAIAALAVVIIGVFALSRSSNR